MEDVDSLRVEWARLLETRPVGERTPEFVEALAQHDAEKRAFLTSLSPEVRRAVLGLSPQVDSPGRRPPPPPLGSQRRVPSSSPSRHRNVSPRPRNSLRNSPRIRPQQEPPSQSYGAWLLSSVQAAAQAVVPVVRNASAVLAPVASRTVQTCVPYAQAAVAKSQLAYSNLPPILPPAVKIHIAGVASSVSAITVTAVQVGREVAANPEVPLAYLRGALQHNFGPQPEIPPAYAVTLPVSQTTKQVRPPPPPNYKNVDPSLLCAEPPPGAAGQENKEGRELSLHEFLEFLTTNHQSLATLEGQTQGLPFEEKLRRITDISAANMSERGITERMLAQAFGKYESDESVREAATRAREHEQRLMSEVEMPAWLTADKLLTIMRDLQDANGEIFPQIIQAEIAGHMPPELMQRCLEINNRCYQRHGVTELQLQTAMMKYRSDPTFAAQIAAQQAEANNRAQTLIAQFQGGQGL